MSCGATLAYKSIGMAAGVLGGVLAGALFKRVWKLVSDVPDEPNAADHDRPWRSLLLAAGVHGAVFGVVRALIDRAGQEGLERVIGEQPDT